MSERHRVSDLGILCRLLLGIVVVFGGLYLAAHLYTDGRVPRGTRVDGVDVGGLSTASATRTLQSALADRAAAPIPVGSGELVGSIDPVTAGLRVDVPATIARIRTADGWTLRDLWDWADGGTSHAAVVTVDPVALSAAVARFASRVDDPAVPAAVTFADGQATARYPVTGSLLDRPAAEAALRREFLHHDQGTGVLELATVADRPAVTKQAVSAAMDDFANPAVSGAVTLRLGSRRVRVQPEEFLPALSMRTDGSSLVPVLDDRALLAAVEPRLRRLTREPRDATVSVAGGRVVVTSGRAGLTYLPADVTRGFLTALASPERTLTLPGVRRAPSVTTADAEAYGITEQVSSAEVPVPAEDTPDLPRVAQLLDGTVVPAGATFSLGRATGLLKGGQVGRGQVGGGQLTSAGGTSGSGTAVATAVFDAGFLAGMGDVERHAPPTYVDGSPLGLDATVAGPSTDLRWRNTTPYAVLVSASVSPSTAPATSAPVGGGTASGPGTLRVSLWSTAYWDVTASVSPRSDPTPPTIRASSDPGCVPQPGSAGFQVDVERVLRRHGSPTVDHSDTLHTTYAPSEAVSCS